MVNVNAQQWLNDKYPKDRKCQRNNDSENKGKSRASITLLDIRKGKVGNGIFRKNKNLADSLKLEGFTNLRKLIVSSHQLISLDVSDCLNLEELDCRGNELVSLKVNGCLNLQKIDCSNNPLRELDLTTCPKLEEVNINNCSNLAEERAVNSNLAYDVEKGKLAKGSAINSPKIRKALDDDVRNILIIGITGNGKSALANTLSDAYVANKFGEKNVSVSVTKIFQTSDVFEWQGKKYRVIDNVGFGDTDEISDEDVLFKIGEGIHSAQEGINQVLFVFGGRFGPEHVEAFNKFKAFISESGITKFTTLVRTNFDSFRDQEECQKDRDNLFSQRQELKEIINSCNGIMHVSNPAIPTIKIGDSEKVIKSKKEDMIENTEERKESRKIVLDHLVENCLEIYKLKE